jgi:hypothetical protein
MWFGDRDRVAQRLLQLHFTRVTRFQARSGQMCCRFGGRRVQNIDNSKHQTTMEDFDARTIAEMA